MAARPAAACEWLAARILRGERAAVPGADCIGIMTAPSLRSRIRSDLIALGSFSFMAGLFVMTARVLVNGGDLLGCAYAATAVMCFGGAIFVGRRIYSRIP